MQENVLKENIEQLKTILEQNLEWQTTYEEQANILLDNREALKQFHRNCKQYIEYLQFYITEVSNTPPTLFKITIRYLGQPIADILITKDNTTITTEPYNNINLSLKYQA